MMKILRWFDPAAFVPNRWQYWGAVFAISLFTIFYNGAGLIPFDIYQKLSINPFITRTDINQYNYFQETVFLPVLANILHLTSPFRFNVLCLLMIMAGYIIFAYNIRKTSSGSNPIPEYTLLMISPITTILFSWIGSPDAVTFLITSILLFSKSNILLFMLGVIGTANHSIIIFAVIPLLILRMFAGNDSINIKSIILFIAGSSIGGLLTYLFLRINHISVLSRIDYMLQQDPNRWIQINLYNFPAVIYSLNGLIWMAILLIYGEGWNNKKYRKFYLAAIAGFYAITFISLDTTRIFSLMSWAMTSHLLINSIREARGNGNNKIYPQVIPIFCIIGLLIPKYYLWQGNIVFTPLGKFYSSLPSMLSILLSKIHP